MKVDTASRLLQRVVAGIGNEFTVGELVITRAGQPENDADLRNTHIAITTYLSAFIRIASTLDDIGKIPRFGARYGWRGGSFQRSDHLRFVWMAFLHLVYVYHERVRIFTNALDEASRYVPIKLPINPGDELKRLKKVIGPFIRERGETVHEWLPDRRETTYLEAVELMSAAGDNKEWDVKGHYHDARSSMLAVVRRFHKSLSAYQQDLFDRYSPVADDLSSTFNGHLCCARADGLEVVAAEPRGWLGAGRSFFMDRFG